MSVTSVVRQIFTCILAHLCICAVLDFVPWWSVARRVVPKVPPWSLRLVTTPSQLIAAFPLISTLTWCLSVAMFTISATAAFSRTCSSGSSKNVCYDGAIHWKPESIRWRHNQYPNQRNSWKVTGLSKLKLCFPDSILVQAETILVWWFSVMLFWAQLGTDLMANMWSVTPSNCLYIYGLSIVLFYSRCICVRKKNYQSCRYIRGTLNYELDYKCAHIGCRVIYL